MIHMFIWCQEHKIKNKVVVDHKNISSKKLLRDLFLHTYISIAKGWQNIFTPFFNKN